MKPFSLAFLLLAAHANARTIVVSLDGMGHESLPEVPALQSLAREGASAALTPHFPSTTSNTHAALWTGAWGDVNGIVGNNMPLAPRAEHSAFAWIPGFSSEGLRAEPIWAAAARQGVSTVAQEATQSYPFKNYPGPLTMLNGYQGKLVAPEMFLHRRDVKEELCPTHCYTWMAGPLALHAVLHGNSMTISAGAASVESRVDAVEADPLANRELARHFSAPLHLAGIPAVVYFRLFELAPNGGDFLLYESPIREQSIFDHGKPDPSAVEQMLSEAGGFLSNAPNRVMTDEPFSLGTPAWKGGDGTAERRYLEIVELLVRQNIRQAQWLLKHYDPRLFIGYLPYPDEIEHTWRGLAVKDPRYARLQHEGFALVNLAVENYTRMRGPNDNLLFVSDHGLAPAARGVHINAALKDAGLLATNAANRPDPAHSQVIHMINCLLVNTEDWQGGIVPLASRAAVIAKAKAALLSIKDPATGDAVVTQIFDSDQDKQRFGYGGPNGPDFCFDLRPGYNTVDGASGPVVTPIVPPRGFHGYVPTRPAMQAILVGVGPAFTAGTAWTGLRSIDVAPLIADVLQISAPKDAIGRSPRK